MLASQAITLLSQLIATHGDLPLFFKDSDYRVTQNEGLDASSIRVLPEAQFNSFSPITLPNRFQLDDHA